MSVVNILRGIKGQKEGVFCTYILHVIKVPVYNVSCSILCKTRYLIQSYVNFPNFGGHM